MITVRDRVLRIKGVDFEVETIDAGEGQTAAFRITKMSGDYAVYDLARTTDGLVICDCADYTYRRMGLTSEPCKHGKAAIHMGLFTPDAPQSSPPSLPAPDACDVAAMLAERADAVALADPPAPDDDEDPGEFVLGPYEDYERTLPDAPLARWIGREAEVYRCLGTEAAEMMADWIDLLAAEVRATGARCPAEHYARVDCLAAMAG